MTKAEKTRTLNKILTQISEGTPLARICEQPGMPVRSTVFKWITKDPEMKAAYELARQEQAHYLFEKAIELAFDETKDRKPIWDDDKKEVVGHTYDKTHIARARLQVDTVKWAAAKLFPRAYGDAARLELTGKDGQPLGALTDEQIDEQIAAKIGVDLETLKLMDDKEIRDRIH